MPSFRQDAAPTGTVYQNAMIVCADRKQRSILVVMLGDDLVGIVLDAQIFNFGHFSKSVDLYPLGVGKNITKLPVLKQSPCAATANVNRSPLGQGRGRSPCDGR